MTKLVEMQNMVLFFLVTKLVDKTENKNNIIIFCKIWLSWQQTFISYNLTFDKATQ